MGRAIQSLAQVGDGEDSGHVQSRAWPRPASPPPRVVLCMDPGLTFKGGRGRCEKRNQEGLGRREGTTCV